MSDTTVCADGTLCAPGWVCNPAGAGCLQSFCGDGERTVGEECDDGPLNSNGVSNACRKDCRLFHCGDGVVDDGELCDDGNTLDNDRCSSDCQSFEECGNGIHDPAAGEECDDGNLRSHDGCSSGCLLEAHQWTDITATGPPRRTSTRMVLAGDRLLMFGGRRAQEPNPPLGDFWENRGRGWNRLPETTPSPPATANHLLTYDPVREALIMVKVSPGSPDAGPAENDTWVYRDDSWTHLVDAQTPPMEALAASGFHRRDMGNLVFDTASGRPTLLRATAEGVGVWQLDGGEWVGPVDVGPRPGWRVDAAAAHDPLRGVTVLFGGWSPGGNPLLAPADAVVTDTWEYSNGSWTLIQPDGGPWPTAFEAKGLPRVWRPDCNRMAFSPAHASVVLMSSYHGLHTLMDDAWVFLDHLIDADRVSAGFAPDQTGALLVTGGITHGMVPQIPTWRFSDNGWLTAAHGMRPAWGSRFAMTFDHGNDRMLAVSATIDDRDSVWFHDGAAWTLVPTPEFAAMASPTSVIWSPERDAVLMVVQPQGTPARNKVQYLTDGIWVPLDTNEDGPAGRYDPLLAWDPDKRRIVLYGGADPDNNLLRDTWQLVGETWTKVDTAPPEPAVSGVEAERMVYSPAIGKLLLVRHVLGQNLQVWALADAGWMPYEPIHGAVSGRSGFAATIHPPTGRLMVIGGTADEEFITDGYVLGPGGQWSPITGADAAPGGRFDADIAYDWRMRHLLLYGGTGEDRTHALAYSSPTPSEDCTNGLDDDTDGLTDCDDPDCNGYPVCDGGEHCFDGVDNDGDNAIDCADDNCGGAACRPEPCDASGCAPDLGFVCVAKQCRCWGGQELEVTCSDGRDNDCDGLADEDDPDCPQDPP